MVGPGYGLAACERGVRDKILVNDLCVQGQGAEVRGVEVRLAVVVGGWQGGVGAVTCSEGRLASAVEGPMGVERRSSG